MIINSGITEVVYEDEYHFNTQTRAMFKEAGVEMEYAEAKTEDEIRED